MRRRFAKGTKLRLVLTSALLSILVLTPITYALDAEGGHPAKSAPLYLWIMWFVILVVGRLTWRWGKRVVTSRSGRGEATTAEAETD